MTNQIAFTPIAKERVFSDVAKQIKAYILSKSLAPGDRLPSERALGQQLQIGRSSVREAVRSLEAEGILEVRHGAGTYIQQTAMGAFLRDAAEEVAATEGGPLAIMQARIAVEPTIACLAAEHADDELVRRLNAATHAMEEQIGDAAPSREHDLEFHQALAELCDNPVLGEMGCRLCALRLKLPWKSVMNPSLEAAQVQQGFVNSHREIIEAIRNRDGQQASASMLKHLQQAECEVKSRLPGQQKGN